MKNEIEELLVKHGVGFTDFLSDKLVDYVLDKQTRAVGLFLDQIIECADKNWTSEEMGNLHKLLCAVLKSKPYSECEVDEEL